jgi:hypothetical protein
LSSWHISLVLSSNSARYSLNSIPHCSYALSLASLLALVISVLAIIEALFLLNSSNLALILFAITSAHNHSSLPFAISSNIAFLVVSSTSFATLSILSLIYLFILGFQISNIAFIQIMLFASVHSFKNTS